MINFFQRTGQSDQTDKEPRMKDDDLRTMIRELEKEEDEISFRRRVLHGRIDILRAELVARLREQVSAGEAQLADVERLSEILTAKAAPTEDE